MKPFLILQLRKNDEASDGEFNAFLKFGGLTESSVHRVRMEKTGLPKINLEDYSAVLVGGGGSNVSDSKETKSPEQLRFDTDLTHLFEQILSKDFPYLGACYGLGALAQHCGAIVSKEKYAENAGATSIKLTKDGKKDELLKGIPDEFRAFLGHKESCQILPEGAVLLASSDACPYHMLRFGNNVYATQFHPELDVDGIKTRIDVYKNHGYFPAEDAERLKKECEKEDITVPMQILKRFIDKYKKGK